MYTDAAWRAAALSVINDWPQVLDYDPNHSSLLTQECLGKCMCRRYTLRVANKKTKKKRINPLKWVRVFKASVRK